MTRGLLTGMGIGVLIVAIVTGVLTATSSAQSAPQSVLQAQSGVTVLRAVVELSNGESVELVPAQTAPATNTPTPTAPPTSTPEPGFATPTPETVTATPGPTASPPHCVVKVGGHGIRLRATPGIGVENTIIGALDYGTVQTVYGWQWEDGYLWAQNEAGWFAAHDQSAWWVYGVDGQTETCVDVPGWPSGMVPPAPIVMLDRVHVGFKVTPGASADVLIEFARRLPGNYKAVVFVVQDTEMVTRLHDAGIYVVFVPWSTWPGDCANTSMSPATSAANRLRYVEQQAGAATFDAVVLTNECHWPDADYYADWALAAMNGCDARGWTCAPTVWNPGTPDLAWLPALDEMHCEMARRGHLYGANIYPYWPLDLMTRNADTAYTTWRHEIIQARMDCSPRWMATELAPDGGGWPPDPQGTVAYIKATDSAIAFFGVWYYGNPLGAWPQAAWSAADVLALAAYLS